MDRIEATTRVDTSTNHAEGRTSESSGSSVNGGKITAHRRGVNAAAGIVSSNDPNIQKAYEHGATWEKPALTKEAKTTGGYTLDAAPADFEATVEAREQAPAIAQETIKCGVTEHAIDSTVFSDANVLLEIVQNAESKDSKGTWFDVQFFAQGKWHSVVGRIQDFSDGEIEKVRIVDNGKGYMPQDMTTIGGAKRYDPESAGRFGSGMKLSDRIALGHGMMVSRYARNWRAKPYLDQGVTSAGQVHTVSYNVEYHNDIFPGSVVEYENPTQELISALRGIEDIYLPLDRTFEERLLFQNKAGIILKPKHEGGRIMVAGRSYELTIPTEKPLLFSYDLHNCSIDDQNRHFVDTSKVTQNIREILENTNDVELFKQLLNSIGEDNKGFHEHTMPGLHNPPQAFIEAVKAHFEITDFDKTYIDNTGQTKENDRALLKRKGYRGIEIPNSIFISETLAAMHIFCGRDIISRITATHYIDEVNPDDFKGENLPSVACRAIYSLRRHGNEETVVLIENNETGESKEIPYDEFIKSSIPEGFSISCLIVRIPNHRLTTEWPKEALVDQFENYLLASHFAGVETSVYNGTDELNHAKNWRGAPVILERKWKNCDPTDLEIRIYVENQSQADELKNLHKYSLDLNGDYAPFEKTQYGDIVQLDGAHIYQQGIKAKARNTDPDMLFSYNLTTKGGIAGVSTADEIRLIVQSARRPEVPLAILRKAKEAGQFSSFTEFFADIQDDEIKGNWRAAFEKIFGEEAVMNDLRNTREEIPADMAAASSGIKIIRLPNQLVETLKQCGVRVLSKAVIVEKAKVYQPNPLQAEFLKISSAIDAIIEEALPRNVKKITPKIVLANSVSNPYGQTLKTGNGYLNPTLQDNTIYVFDSVVTKGKIDQLVTFLLSKKTEVYSQRMPEAEYLEFRTRVINIAATAITNVNFFNKVRGMMFNKKQRFGQLVEVLISESQNVKHEPEEDIVITGNIEETRWAITNLLHNLAKGVDAAIANIGAIAAIGLKTTAKVAGVLALAGVVVGGGYMAVSSVAESDWLKNALAKVEKAVNTPGTEGYQRPRLSQNQPIGVSIERRNIQHTENEAGENYAQDALANFITIPKLSWGYFMSETSLTKYNGKGWEEDPNAPEFENPNYSHTKRFAHYQKTGGSKKVELRTRTAGYIDLSSIKLIKKDGNQDLSYLTKQLPHGEVEITILADDIEAVLYQTSSPVNWQEDAAKLNNEDFSKLDSKTYEYYTATPSIDLSKIPFKSAAFSEFDNYQQFVDYLKILKPIDRVTAIRSVVLKMRYTRTERTEEAFAKFHNGSLSQKDFLEFILSSDQLENPGDGDCDTQNTIASLLFRYAGIPSKLDFVFTDGGDGHGPASIFLPNIGWVLADTMGDRTIIERISTEDPRLNDNGHESTTEEAQQRIIDALRKHAEYQARECYKFD